MYLMNRVLRSKDLQEKETVNIIKLTNRVKQKADEIFEGCEKDICRALDTKFNYAGRGFLYTRLSDSKDERSYDCLCMNIWSKDYKLKLVGIKETPGAFLAVDCVPVKLQTYQTILEHGELLRGNWIFTENYPEDIVLDEVSYIHQSEIHQEEREERDEFNQYWMEYDSYNAILNRMSQEKEKVSLVKCEYTVKENLIYLALDEIRDCFQQNMLIAFREPKTLEWRLLGTVLEKKNQGRLLIVEVLNEELSLEFLKRKKNLLEIRIDDRGTKVRLARQRTAINNLYYHNTANPYLKELLEDYHTAQKEKTDLVFKQQGFEEKQNEALQKVLSARDIAVIQGPPGTGKTTVISRLIQEIIKENKTVLIASATHVAVDNVLQRVGSYPGVYAVRIGKEEKIEEDCKGYLFDTYVENLRNRILENLSKVRKVHETIFEQEQQTRIENERYQELLPKLQETLEAKLIFEEEQKRFSKLRLDLQIRTQQREECQNKLIEVDVSVTKEEIELFLKKLRAERIVKAKAIQFSQNETPESWSQTKEYCSVIKKLREAEWEYAKEIELLKKYKNTTQSAKSEEEAQREKRVQLEKRLKEKWSEAKEKEVRMLTDASPQAILMRKKEYIEYSMELSKLICLLRAKDSYRKISADYKNMCSCIEQYDKKVAEIDKKLSEYQKNIGSKKYWMGIFSFCKQENFELQELQKAIRLFGVSNLPLDMDVKEACLFTYEKLEQRKRVVAEQEDLKREQEQVRKRSMQIQFEISGLEQELNEAEWFERYRDAYREHILQKNIQSSNATLRKVIFDKKQEYRQLDIREQEIMLLYRTKQLERQKLEKELDGYYRCLAKWKTEEYAISEITRFGNLLIRIEEWVGLDYERIERVSLEKIDDYFNLEEKKAVLLEEREEKEKEYDKINTEYQNVKKEYRIFQKQAAWVLSDLNLDDSLNNCLPAEQYKEIVQILQEMISICEKWESLEVERKRLETEQRKLTEEKREREQKKNVLDEQISQLLQRLPPNIQAKSNREAYYEQKTEFIALENMLGEEFAMIWHVKYLPDLDIIRQRKNELEMLNSEIQRISAGMCVSSQEFTAKREQYEALSEKFFTEEVRKEFEEEDLVRIVSEISAKIQRNNDAIGRGDDLSKTQQIRREWEEGLALQKEFLEERCIRMANVVCATCSGIVSNDNQYFQNKKYDYVIIDEAAKCDTLDMLIPMTMGRKIVLVGDHKQLKPVLDPEVLEQMQEDLAEEFLEVKESGSLFQKTFLEIDPSFKTMLNVQYRMAPQIADFISNQYYNGMLLTGKTKKNDPLVLSMFGNSMVWFDSGTYDRETSIGNSYGNEKEAELTLKILRYIDNALSADVRKQVGIIAPYRGQIQLLNQLLQNEAYMHLEVECNTVDAFQGREKDYIIMNYVRNNIHSKVGFSVEDERMNVAISRSRELFIMVASASFVEMNTVKMKTMYSLFAKLKQEGMIKNERFLLC